MSDKPRNPFAIEDFANAIKETTEKISKEFEKIGEQIQKNVAEDKVTFMGVELVEKNNVQIR